MFLCDSSTNQGDSAKSRDSRQPINQDVQPAGSWNGYYVRLKICFSKRTRTSIGLKLTLQGLGTGMLRLEGSVRLRQECKLRKRSNENQGRPDAMSRVYELFGSWEPSIQWLFIAHKSSECKTGRRTVSCEGSPHSWKIVEPTSQPKQPAAAFPCHSRPAGAGGVGVSLLSRPASQQRGRRPRARGFQHRRFELSKRCSVPAALARRAGAGDCSGLGGAAAPSVGTALWLRAQDFGAGEELQLRGQLRL